MTDRRPLIIVTGTSATLQVPDYLIALRPVLGAGTRCLMTHNATRFLPPESLGWFGCEVLSPATPGVNPVELALTASSILVLPASAQILATAALGIASSPAATVLLAAPAGCLFFPHTNPVMWDKDIIQQHVSALRAQGHIVVDPEPREVFEMWRGDFGKGMAMPRPEQAARIVAGWLPTAGLS
jgi:phosphopantothenoylcysteine synthetase/decarboxylase